MANKKIRKTPLVRRYDDKPDPMSPTHRGGVHIATRQARKNVTNVTFTDEEYRDLISVANAHGTSMNQTIRILIRQELHRLYPSGLSKKIANQAVKQRQKDLDNTFDWSNPKADRIARRELDRYKKLEAIDEEIKQNQKAIKLLKYKLKS